MSSGDQADEEKKGVAPRRVTAEDVAQMAGVSRSAVSRVYTPGAYVSQEKRERIRQVADLLGYRPNALAASLNMGSSNLVAIVTGNLLNHYDGEVVGKLVEGLSQVGKWPVVLGGTSDDIRSSEILDVLAYPLDALIVRGGSVDEAIAAQCAKLNVPIIISGRVMEASGVDSVCCNNSRGAEMAVEHFVKNGRRSIAYIGGSEELASEQERHHGFRTAMSEAGLAPFAVKRADFSFNGGYAQTLEILSGPTRPDALFCSNDAMALGALNAARNTLGMSVPESMGIIGFDDIAMAEWPCFRLTTIRNPLDVTVDQILDLLATRLANPKRPDEIRRLEPTLIQRATD